MNNFVGNTGMPVTKLKYYLKLKIWLKYKVFSFTWVTLCVDANKRQNAWSRIKIYLIPHVMIGDDFITSFLNDSWCGTLVYCRGIFYGVLHFIHVFKHFPILPSIYLSNVLLLFVFYKLSILDCHIPLAYSVLFLIIGYFRYVMINKGYEFSCGHIRKCLTYSCHKKDMCIVEGCMGLPLISSLTFSISLRYTRRQLRSIAFSSRFPGIRPDILMAKYVAAWLNSWYPRNE